MLREGKDHVFMPGVQKILKKKASERVELGQLNWVGW
jgi:hypothetical protein